MSTLRTSWKHLGEAKGSVNLCVSVCAYQCVCKQSTRAIQKYLLIHREGVRCFASLGAVCGRCVFKAVKSTGTAVQESSQVLSGRNFNSSALPSSISHLRKINRWGKGSLSLIKHHLHWWYGEKYGVSALQRVAVVLGRQKILSFHSSRAVALVTNYPLRAT